MVLPIIAKKLEYIDNLFTYFNQQNLDEEMKSHIAKYLTVIVSGTYEECVECIFRTYFHNQIRDSRIEHYLADVWLDRTFRNPDSKNLITLMNNFDKSWSEIIQQKYNSELQSLNNIKTNKDTIAHGGNSNVTMKDIYAWYTESKEIILEVGQVVLIKDMENEFVLQLRIAYMIKQIPGFPV